jgi:hypothetical protein
MTKLCTHLKKNQAKIQIFKQKGSLTIFQIVNELMQDQPGVAQGWIQSFIGQKRTSEITLIACILYNTHNDQVAYLLIKKK